MTEGEWRACTEPYRMLEFLRDSGAGARKLRLFACACCRLIWPLLTDPRSRAAVGAAEADVEGRLAPGELERARARSHEARMEDPRNWRTPAGAAHALLIPDRHHGVGVAMDSALLARDAEDGYTGSWGRYFNADDPNYAPSHPAQAHLLRDVFGNPFRPARLVPAWLTAEVRALAEGAYEGRSLPAGTLEPARLALLADSLEDAGCDNAEVLGHLRSGGPHVRGCWCVDLLLGQS